MFDAPIQQLLDEMVASGKYRAIIWAGGYPQHRFHRHSDVDLYAVSAEELPSHWVMERVSGRRVELTTFTLDRWQEILRKQHDHPKHHYTFVYGKVLFDPEQLCPTLASVAAEVLTIWKTSIEEIDELRNGVAIQHDKILGYREKGMHSHVRLYAVGFGILACRLLATVWDGYAVDAGKNLSRVMSHPDCPSDVRGLLIKLLTSPDTEEMADAAIGLCDCCLELTGGPMNSYRGGILR